MVAGRPRTVSPDPEESIELGKEMVEWVSQNKPTHLSEWYSLEKYIPYKIWKNMCDMPEFSPYYEVALNLVAKNSRDGTLDKSLSQRFLSMYHRDLSQFERDEKVFESKLKAQETLTINDDYLNKFDSYMQRYGLLQSERKIDNNNNNTDTKSA